MVKWYAIYTRPKHEKKLREALEEKGIETFLPLIKTVRQWKDRKKKIEVPLFNGYIFIHIDYKDRFSALQTKGAVKIVNFSGEPVVVPEWQIESLRKMLTHPEKIQLENYMKIGDPVVVDFGPFKGMKGVVKMLKGKRKLVITIDGIMQTVSVEIDADEVKKIPQEGGNG
jgi:transcription antitermination factor NusG